MRGFAERRDDDISCGTTPRRNAPYGDCVTHQLPVSHVSTFPRFPVPYLPSCSFYLMIRISSKPLPLPFFTFTLCSFTPRQFHFHFRSTTSSAAPMIPKVMKGVQMKEFGGPEVLLYRTDLPVPVPRDGEVLVKNDFIGINYVDV